jgi:hypothetical protein
LSKVTLHWSILSLFSLLFLSFFSFSRQETKETLRLEHEIELNSPYRQYSDTFNAQMLLRFYSKLKFKHTNKLLLEGLDMLFMAFLGTVLNSNLRNMISVPWEPHIIHDLQKNVGSYWQQSDWTLENCSGDGSVNKPCDSTKHSQWGCRMKQTFSIILLLVYQSLTVGVSSNLTLKSTFKSRIN